MSLNPNTTGNRKLRRVRAPLRFASLRVIMALILREMSTTYGRSPGGYAWMILEPVLGIALLTAVFSLGFRTPPLGTNFPIFYASGLLPFFMFQIIANNVSQSINNARALLAYPRVTFIDTILARLILATVTQLLVGIILFTLIVTVFETRTVLKFDRIFTAYAMAISLGAGIGIMNCLLISRYQIWQRAWSIIMRPAFLISGVIFIYENIPQPYGDYLLWNPLMHITAEMRAGFYYSYDATYVSPSYVFSIAAGAGLLGLIFLRRYNKDLREL
ncbi:ABC transporter permease [Pseudothioclava nitratireducens]|uniref:ABC transporter permease n=1 Tax=Pseudothioclava nitratireducens TaxID=1928646 RepID=UPI0023DB821D|nr:ABC transporter permease [Defluviimonas nitratireducens]MDF1619979.1 ABC transporter permease [Defluviimonas nitratireducens]